MSIVIAAYIGTAVLMGVTWSLPSHAHLDNSQSHPAGNAEQPGC